MKKNEHKAADTWRLYVLKYYVDILATSGDNAALGHLSVLDK
jgi:hypothetical protein